MINRTIKIGISSIGSGVGQSVINSIRLSNLPIRTFGFGTNELAYGLYECDEHVISLSFYDPDYINDTIRKCLDRGIELYIPGHDDDAHICAKNIKRFDENGIKVIVAGKDLLDICRDKEAMSNELNKISNIFVRSFDKKGFIKAYKEKEVKFPVIAKPRDGFASRGIEIINSEDDVVKITDSHIVQELAMPNSSAPERNYYLEQLRRGINPQVSEISIQIVADENGGIIGKMISYNKLNNGIPIEIIPFEDEYIWKEINKIYPKLKELGLRGPFNLQGRLTDEGLKLFELNARFTGITGLRAFMGFNEVESCIKQWLGIRQSDEKLIFNHGRFGIRQTADKSIDFDRNVAVWDIYKTINKKISKRKKNILITGATGYLGRNLIRELLLNNNEFNIWAWSRDKRKLVELFADNVIAYDVKDFEEGILSMGNIDILLHAGFARPHCTTNEIAESIEFSTRFLTKAFQNQVPHIINISSQSVYGQGADIPWTEATPINTNTVYSAAKYGIEQLMIGLQKLYPHINGTSIRLGALTGGAEGLVNIDLISKIVSNVLEEGKIKILGGGQIMERLDIRDAVRGIVSIIRNTDKKWAYQYNLGSGKQYTLIEIAEIIEKCAKELGYNVDLKKEEHNDMLKFGLSIESFKNDFDWQPEYELKDTVLSLFDYLEKS